MNDTTPSRASDRQSGKSPDERSPFAGTRHLDALDLDRLTGTFRSWAASGAGPAVCRSRRRVLLVYLLLRHTGARLGEILALDDLTDVDPRALTARLPGREAQLPPSLGQELAEAFADPEFAALRGRLFRLDPAHVRRKFYERAAEAGLPREAANPNALRRSRGVELLRENVPLPVVQRILGHSTAELTAGYLDYSVEDARRIEKGFIERQTRKTSARNAFHGRIDRIVRGDVQALVEVVDLAGRRVAALITNGSLAAMELEKGLCVTAEIKAPLVLLAKPGPDGRAPRMGAANCYPGVVRRIVRGKISHEVLVELDEDIVLCALLAVPEAKGLDPKPGDPVLAAFQAHAVVLKRD